MTRLRLAVAAAWRLLRPGPREPFLEDDVLVGWGSARLVRLPLSEVRHVTTDWTPYVGAELVVSGDGRYVRIRLDPATERLRRDVGQRVVRNGPSVVETTDVRRHLGLA